jgi:hypothetical protein
MSGWVVEWYNWQALLGLFQGTGAWRQEDVQKVLDEVEVSSARSGQAD